MFVPDHPTVYAKMNPDIDTKLWIMDDVPAAVDGTFAVIRCGICLQVVACGTIFLAVCIIALDATDSKLMSIAGTYPTSYPQTYVVAGIYLLITGILGVLSVRLSTKNFNRTTCLLIAFICLQAVAFLMIAGLIVLDTLCGATGSAFISAPTTDQTEAEVQKLPFSAPRILHIIILSLCIIQSVFSLCAIFLASKNVCCWCNGGSFGTPLGMLAAAVSGVPSVITTTSRDESNA